MDESNDFTPDRTLLKDTKGGYLTQMLFYETTSDYDRAMYTLMDTDKVRNGRVYPSLRRLYLEMADPTEYDFANKYLWGWEHWQKIVANVLLYDYIRLWRDELEVKLRAKGVRSMIDLAEKGNFNASKWVSDGHWNVKRGRPSKEEIARERKIKERVDEETQGDSERVSDLVARLKTKKEA